MMRKGLLLLLLLLMTSTSVWSLEIGGVTLPDTMKAGDADLVLNGAGIRRKFGLKVYAVGLYLKSKSTDGNAVLGADEAMALDMHYRMGIPPRKIQEVFYESFALALNIPEANTYGPETDYGPLSNDIVSFMNWITERDTTKQDSWIFKYIPGKGTEVYIHDGTVETLKGVIPGADFKKALFSIWIGEDPAVGKSLRKDLLGM